MLHHTTLWITRCQGCLWAGFHIVQGHLEREEAGLAATLPLCVASKRAKCQVCSSEEPAEKGEVVELFGICHRELQGATAILREARSDGMCVELLHQGLRLCRSVPRDTVRRFNGDGKDLLKCGACKACIFAHEAANVKVGKNTSVFAQHPGLGNQTGPSWNTFERSMNCQVSDSRPLSLNCLQPLKTSNFSLKNGHRLDGTYI